MIQSNESIGTPALSAVIGYIAQRSNVCAKVLDREGRVVAINRRGLELLETRSEDICGEIWSAFWSGADHLAARAAVDCAFGGKPAEFIGTFRAGGAHSAWEVEALPLEWIEGQVDKVLVLSTRLAAPSPAPAEGGAHPDAEVLGKLRETFHALNNIATVSTSGANILRRGIDAERGALLADSLEQAGLRAQKAIEDLNALLKMQGLAGA